MAKLGTVAVKGRDLFSHQERPLYVEDYRIFINLVQAPIWTVTGLLLWLVVAANQEFLARPVLFGGLVVLVIAPALVFIILLQKMLLGEFRRIELFERFILIQPNLIRGKKLQIPYSEIEMTPPQTNGVTTNGRSRFYIFTGSKSILTSSLPSKSTSEPQPNAIRSKRWALVNLEAKGLGMDVFDWLLRKGVVISEYSRSDSIGERVSRAKKLQEIAAFSTVAGALLISLGLYFGVEKVENLITLSQNESDLFSTLLGVGIALLIFGSIGVSRLKFGKKSRKELEGTTNSQM